MVAVLGIAAVALASFLLGLAVAMGVYARKPAPAPPPARSDDRLYAIERRLDQQAADIEALYGRT